MTKAELKAHFLLYAKSDLGITALEVIDHPYPKPDADCLIKFETEEAREAFAVKLSDMDDRAKREDTFTTIINQDWKYAYPA